MLAWWSSELYGATGAAQISGSCIEGPGVTPLAQAQANSPAKSGHLYIREVSSFTTILDDSLRNTDYFKN